MKIYQGKALEDYKSNALEINPNWEKRDFTSRVRRYLEASTEKILAVGGLRGTGKTVGILQAAEGLDVCYVLSQTDESETGKDYIEFLKNSDEKLIIFDEYSWIRDRKELDRYLLTAVQNGKRIVITGTESISLEYLNYGTLIHRVNMIHTTIFPYDEYRRIYGLQHTADVCDGYLRAGGIFKEYAIDSFATMKAYIEDAIVKNLAGYLKDEMNKETARTLTYAVLYKAVCPANLSNVPLLRENGSTLDEFLDTMGINSEVEIRDRDLRNVVEIFEQAGIIVRIKNFDENSPLREQYYIANPSLTCQLILATYNIPVIPNAVLGYVFEACAIVQLHENKLSEHEMYFIDTEGQPNAVTKERVIVITDIEREHVYLFGCKYTENNQLKQSADLLFGYIEKTYFRGADVDGRYVIYNGEPCVKGYDLGDILFVNLGRELNDYYAFESFVETFHHHKITGV